jgi:hypothetical protein
VHLASLWQLTVRYSSTPRCERQRCSFLQSTTAKGDNESAQRDPAGSQSTQVKANVQLNARSTAQERLP